MYTEGNSLRSRDWTARGACVQPENEQLRELFFARTAAERRPARNLCISDCLVRRQCLQAALEKHEIWGVWGGLDEGEIRRALQVDADDQPLSRCRFPQCPYCHARPSQLHVVSACLIHTGRVVSWVECQTCQFKWSAPTSIAAVKTYWRQRRRIQRARDRLRRAQNKQVRDREQGRMPVPPEPVVSGALTDLQAPPAQAPTRAALAHMATTSSSTEPGHAGCRCGSTSNPAPPAW